MNETTALEEPAAAGSMCRSWGPVVALALGLAVSTSGCGIVDWARNGLKVGPNYVEPQVATAATWIDFKDPRVKSETADITSWWTVFGDPALDQLIELGTKQSLTLRAAGERIAAARANLGFAVGNIFPQQQQATGGYTRTGVSLETANNPSALPGFRRDFDGWQVGGTVAWELDFWGKFRRAIESAEADLDASVADYDDVLVLLLAEIARNYIDYRTYSQRLAFANENVEVQRRAYELASDRFKAGAAGVTERDVHQAKQVLESTRATVPPLEAGSRQAQNALCVLLGLPPRELPDLLPASDTIPHVPQAVAVGIPADLLRRRPDVRRAERNAASQSAQIGIAEADFYPSFSIGGQLGVAAENFPLLGRSKAILGSVGPSFTWNILNYGRIGSRVEAAEAHFRELVATYVDTVNRAGRETEDAIVLFLTSQERAAHLAESVAESERTVTITLDQYKVGAVDFTPVFLFEETLAQQKDQLAAARGDIARNLVALYQSLGGGWKESKQ
jgi:NodT family efflux transporter outer membrane factor (OMF) lipoprotein